MVLVEIWDFANTKNDTSQISSSANSRSKSVLKNAIDILQKAYLAKMQKMSLLKFGII